MAEKKNDKVKTMIYKILHKN